ncbi:flavin-dependent dehydrogenase [Dyadobacter jejuensis]|uniref:Flavin-dependent dehydrogenase n=1 Tax=Dyadobacter jejuensis TaxID=1082580 RepID=A0A316ALV6_9BACT|nr:NAD(P)/FAD-dependent oxidoreductase [Dyadobacter jejuensis]PWJ58551.1 flavin-dependent dehydrogenase [Dyadobacter jejuensis]
MQEIDVLVIGAGPAGTVAASYLAGKGYRVTILEKETFPRFQIGESLLPCCMEHLQEAGLLEAIKKLDFQKKTGAAFMRGSQRCEFYFTEQYTNGWSWTWQVKRADFDLALALETERKGVQLLFNCSVETVSCSEKRQHIQYRNPDNQLIDLEAQFVIDASGYGRVLPRLFNLSRPSSFVPRGAIFSHLQDPHRSTAESQNIFVHAFNDNEAWLWAIPFSDGTTSVGIVSEQEYIRSLSADQGTGYWSIIRNFPDLQGRFSDVDMVFEPKAILGYSVGVTRMWGPGFVLAGNSTEFLDPIFSSGVTFATSSGLRAAKLTHRQLQGENVDWQKDYEEVIQDGIDVFRSYVTGWYNGDFQTIVFAKEIDQGFKQQICSVLAGYVWDQSNPFVKKHDTILATLAKVIRIKERMPDPSNSPKPSDRLQ